MFKGNKKFIYIFLGLFVLIILAQYFLPKPKDWSRNYQNTNKSPFGCFALYNVLEGVFSEKLESNDKSFFQFKDKDLKNSSLLIINDKVEFNKNDIKALYSFLGEGNTVFIAANFFNGALADSMHLSSEYGFDSFNLPTDSLLKKEGERIKFTATNLKHNVYRYPALLNASYFTRFDSTRFKILAHYNSNKTCFISTKINGGTLYLMSVPDVFGNYFVANHKNRDLPYTMLSLIRNKTLVWDEYYKSFNVTNSSMMQFIFDNDALYIAYLLLIFTLVLYMIFEGRRRQRAIPVTSALSNSTLEFVDVISHVYYNSHNHHHIAVERIKYFYEIIRRKFNLTALVLDEGLYEEIAELSGVDSVKVRQLFVYCEKIKKSPEITEHELIELNRQIHNFNKNSLR